MLAQLCLHKGDQMNRQTKIHSLASVAAVNAEDVGKLPDQNVDEALQRATGVSIQCSRGEGDFVSIRGLGPTFARGTINNRTLVSATESRDATAAPVARTAPVARPTSTLCPPKWSPRSKSIPTQTASVIAQDCRFRSRSTPGRSTRVGQLHAGSAHPAMVRRRTAFRQWHRYADGLHTGRVN